MIIFSTILIPRNLTFTPGETMTNPPSAVLDSIRNKEAVLFIGSGFSRAAALPSSASIAAFLTSTLRDNQKTVDYQVAGQLDRVAELFEITYGRSRLVSAVESFLRTSPRDFVSPSHRLLASLVKHGFVKTIITTNYDTLIEDACSALGTTLRVVAHESQLYVAAGDQPVLYKIHGDFSHPDLLVFTPADFQRWSIGPEARSIMTQLQALFDRSAILFLGYSLSDFNILSLLLGREFASRGAPRHKRFAALYSSDDFGDTATRLRQYGVEGFLCPDTEQLLRWLLQTLPITLHVKHLVFSYPSWYPDQEVRYGGIETFIRYLKANAKSCSHTTYEAIFGNMLAFAPSRPNSTYPTYPASFFFFRAAAKAALESTLHSGDKTPDVIHVHFLEFAPLPQDAGIPTLCTSHSLLSLDLAYTKGLFDASVMPGAREEIREAYATEKEAALAAHFVTVLSEAHELEVRRLGARSVRRVDAPFDPTEFRPESPESARSRGYQPLAQKFTIAYVGRPDRRKGIEILLKACELLAAENVDFQLLLVGFGFWQSKQQLHFGTGWFSFDISGLRKMGIQIELRQAKGPGETGLYYSQSDIVVVPSLYEPMGYVVLEAMACERPVVASRTGGLPEAISDGINGLFFEVGDAAGLAKKLLALYRDPELRRRLGQQGCKDVGSRRSAADIVRDWEELYRQAAFAFGASLFPPPSLVDSIKKRCEQKIPTYLSSMGVYSAAVAGCDIAKQLIEESEGEFELPQGVPVDRALLGAIAVELQKALRRKGVGAAFSITALADVMNDLALALLNRERDQPNLLLDAEETKRRLSSPWFEQALRNS